MPAVRSLDVSQDRRHLVRPDGTPFFYLADTAWELFHRLTIDEAGRYLTDRAAKGFTVIQAVVLAELDGLNTPTPAGHRPLIDNDPSRPNEAYFRDVDAVVDRAARLGLFVGMLPTWGDKWCGKFPQDKPIFDPATARSWGRFLGERYREKPVIWILGGDRPCQNQAQVDLIRAMASGISEGDGGRHLKTFHPTGQYSSAMWFHHDDWLDFNMIQTGHTRDRDNHNHISAEYARTPIKPVLDGEPGYENHGHSFNPVHGLMDAGQTRKFCYWSLLAGACGHTYGCHEIWQMYAPGRTPITGAHVPWEQAMQLPGATQVGYARKLIESGPYFDRMPDPSMVASMNTTGPHHVQAARAPDGRYALVYFPESFAVTLRVFQLLASRASVEWFDPRTGQRQSAGEIEVKTWGTHAFTPPGPGDWVLILTRVGDWTV
jgi:hypothetical protein